MDPKHQINSATYKKYARSLRRSTVVGSEENMSIHSSLNVNQSLPPLREQFGQPPHTTSNMQDQAVSLSSSVERIASRHSGGQQHPGVSYHLNGQAAKNLSDARLRHIKTNLMKKVIIGKSVDASNNGGLLEGAGPNEYQN